jgi:hypothetical protein
MKSAQAIPNMIKQPAQCCVHCGRSYKKRTNLDKHMLLCELLSKSKSKGKLIIEEDEIEVPSQKKMYEILLELGNKFNKLEEKVDELNQWVVKKKKKINVIEWLNNNITPTNLFDTLFETISMTSDDVKYLFENTYADTLNHIFSRNIYQLADNKYPIIAFVQKPNIFYIYENTEAQWIELNKDTLIKFLNKVYMKLFRVFSQYKKDNAEKIRDDEKFSILCDKITKKVMDVDFRQDATLSKIRTNMYSRMKIDMKAIVEYEFEF